MPLPNSSYDKLIGMFPTMLNSEDPFSFLGLYIGLMLIVVKIKNNKFWYDLSPKLKAVQRGLFALILGLTFVANYWVMAYEDYYERIGLKVRMLIYLMWFAAYALTFGALQYLTYYLFKKSNK